MLSLTSQVVRTVYTLPYLYLNCLLPHQEFINKRKLSAPKDLPLSHPQVSQTNMDPDPPPEFGGRKDAPRGWWPTCAHGTSCWEFSPSRPHPSPLPLPPPKQSPPGHGPAHSAGDSHTPSPAAAAPYPRTQITRPSSVYINAPEVTDRPSGAHAEPMAASKQLRRSARSMPAPGPGDQARRVHSRSAEGLPTPEAGCGRADSHLDRFSQTTSHCDPLKVKNSTYLLL